LSSSAANRVAAVRMLREALAIPREEYPAAHPGTIQAEAWLGEALTATGKPREAEQVLRGAMKEVRSAPFAFGAWRIAEIQAALGICLAAHETSRNGLRSDPHSAFRKLAAERLQ
jgi:hypothetical protein